MCHVCAKLLKERKEKENYGKKREGKEKGKKKKKRKKKKKQNLGLGSVSFILLLSRQGNSAKYSVQYVLYIPRGLPTQEGFFQPGGKGGTIMYMCIRTSTYWYEVERNDIRSGKPIDTFDRNSFSRFEKCSYAEFSVFFFWCRVHIKV